MQNTITITEAGCFLDNHRGHYISRDVIELAESFGFILGSCEKYVVSRYEQDGHADDYPFEAIYEICDEAINWLNSSPTEREISGQNMPPKVPDAPTENTHYVWGFEDGDFGLWLYDEEGEVVDLPILG